MLPAVHLPKNEYPIYYVDNRFFHFLNEFYPKAFWMCSCSCRIWWNVKLIASMEPDCNLLSCLNKQLKYKTRIPSFYFVIRNNWYRVWAEWFHNQRLSGRGCSNPYNPAWGATAAHQTDYWHKVTTQAETNLPSQTSNAVTTTQLTTCTGSVKQNKSPITNEGSLCPPSV